MATKYTINIFKKEYSTEAACLDRILKLKYPDLKTCPKCNREATFTRIKTRPCYHCDKCYYQIYPTVGTIFEKSTTPLTSWFFAMYLFTASKNGLSAKELERHLGVTYKCAFRMLHKIRSILENDKDLLSGVVELDETFVGGKNINRHYDKKIQGCQGRSHKDKTPVFGMLERGGNVVAKVVKDTKIQSIIPIAKRTIEEGSIVCTDEYSAYDSSRPDYIHERVNHNIGQYANGDVTTNRIENFWSNVKRTLKGSYITVSPKYLQNYVNECTFKYNNKGNKNLFNELLEHI
ncbi:MAG TPA: IS1595 family transposase [Chitinophagales bacterium]|nr:IS1595 family transposase [Chitinophagales bacterium]